MLHVSGLLPNARRLGEAFGACQGTVARPHRKDPGVVLAAWPAGRVEDHEGHRVGLKGVYGSFQGRIQCGLGLPRALVLGTRASGYTFSATYIQDAV